MGVKIFLPFVGITLNISKDTVGCKRNMNRYASLDTTFTTKREAKFINGLIEAIEQGDQGLFTSIVVEYNQVMALDNWKTSILLKIKRGIDEEPGVL